MLHPHLGTLVVRGAYRTTLLLLASLTAASTAFAGATTTVIGTVGARGHIAQGGGLVVVTQLAGDGTATLAIGSKNGAPRAIRTRPLPEWGLPHVGTSELGTTVIVYPSCARPTSVRSCNLRVFDVTFGTDQPLSGSAATRGHGEIEGDMDRGALAIVRWTADPGVPNALALGGTANTATQLLYQPFGQPARRLTPLGGQQIDLDRGRIAQVRDADPSPACNAPAIEIVTIQQTMRVLAQRRCAAVDEVMLAPTFFDRQLVWGLRTASASTIQRAATRGGQRILQAPTVPFAVAAPSGPRAAFQLRGDVTPALGADATRLTSAWTFALSEDLALH
jgi:hypothetical protein